MHRIFPYLAGFVFLCLAATMVAGFLVEMDESSAGSPRWNHWRRIHFLAGLVSALAVMFVSGIIVTYFIGTSRWCREVAETYSLDPRFAQRSNALKRRTFPITLAVMLITVSLAALGAAADTRMEPPLGENGIQWSEIHLIAAFVTLAFIAYAAVVQWTHLRANQQVIGEIMAEVRRIRDEKGLE